MHLLIPHAAALGDACPAALAQTPLPRLAELLARLRPTARAGDDEFSPAMPHEARLAQLRGEPAGAVPTAAWLAGANGLDPREPWALLTPLHFAVGTDGVRALAPEDFGAAEARAYFDLLAPLFPAVEGWRCHFAGPRQWLVGHASLADLAREAPVASVERVLARSVEPWMPAARRLRTLQNEAQMLLHEHPLNQAREARGRAAVNSIWISGCGASTGTAPPARLAIDARLSAALLAGDWPAWMAGWRELDAGPVQALLDAARAGTAVTLTLAGERHAQTFEPAPANGLRGLWQRFRPPRADVAAVLEAL
ncbi:MAG: hypothetical protein JO224_00395 [Pelomonas sp.]|nr:hypothetical protein [Roseateles sp.]